MRSLSKRKVVPTLGACVLVCSVFAIVTAAAQQEPAPKKQEPTPKKQEPAPKKTAPKPKVALRKANFVESKLKLINSFATKPAIAYKDITLEQFQMLAGDKTLTLASKVAVPNRKKGAEPVMVTVEQVLEELKPIQKWLNARGYTLLNKLADYPKGGAKYALTNARPASFAKQKKALADAHTKATKAQKAKAFDVNKITSAKAADLSKWREDNREALLKQAANAKLTPNQTKIVNLLKKPDALTNKATMKEVAKLLLKEDPNPLPGNIFSITQADYHKTKSFSIGDAEIAEADFVVDLEITAKINPFIIGEELSARASLNGNLFILDGSKSSPDNIVDVLAQFDTGGASGDLFQAHAKLLGTDIFTPISKTIPTDGQQHNDGKDFPFDVNVLNGNIGAFGIGIGYGIDVKGDFNVNVLELATPTEITVVPTIALNANLNATVSLDAGIAEVDVTGTLNLVNDKLTIVGAEQIISGKVSPLTPPAPFLDILGSADNTLSALGGNISLVVFGVVPFTDIKTELGSITLLSVPDQVTVSGFLFGPDETKVPIGTTSTVNADDKKKKK